MDIYKKNLKKIVLDSMPRGLQSSIRRRRKQIDQLRLMYWKLKYGSSVDKLEKPVFMIGAPRSGTTLSVKLFDMHPDIADWSEAGHIWDPRTYYDTEADHLWTEDMLTDIDRKRIHDYFNYYRISRDKQRFINKHPRNSIRLGYLDAVFPDACYIHIVRDGRAVVNSILHNIATRPERQGFPYGNFCKPPNWRKYLDENLMVQASWQWSEIVQYILDYAPKLPGRYMMIKYEDICVDTKGAFREMFEFSGLDADDNVLSALPATINSMNYKYREIFSADELGQIEAIISDQLKELGYLDQ